MAPAYHALPNAAAICDALPIAQGNISDVAAIDPLPVAAVAAIDPLPVAAAAIGNRSYDTATYCSSM